MFNQSLWLMQESSESLDRRLTGFAEDASLGMINFLEVDDFLTELLYTQSMKVTGDPLIPAYAPHPLISLPPDFAPDYFQLSSMIFVSRRFREALKQPPDVVQYWHVELAEGSSVARQQDYSMLRVLAWQPAMDLNRSVYHKEDIVNRRTGEQLVAILSIDRFIPLADLVARTSIFRAAEEGLSILVTDKLAERVMLAGCDGVTFREPETCGMVNREPRRIRTAKGIVVEDADLTEWATARS